MSTDMEERAAEKRCVPTSQRTGVKTMAVRTWQTVNPMAMRMQRTGVSLMAVGTQLSGDNSGIGTVHSYQRSLTKTQRTNNPMAIGAQRTDFGPRVAANYFHP